jgi:hypothetical protein
VAVDAGDGAAARSTFAGLVTRYERLESDLIGEAGFCLWRLAPRVHAQAEQARVAAAMRAKRDANARAVEQAVASDLATLRKDEKETLETNILGPLIIFFAQDRFTAMHVGAPLRNLLNPRPIGPLLIEPERFDQQLIQGLELTKEVPRDRTQYYEQLALLALERHIYFGD